MREDRLDVFEKALRCEGLVVRRRRPVETYGIDEGTWAYTVHEEGAAETEYTFVTSDRELAHQRFPSSAAAFIREKIDEKRRSTHERRRSR